MAGVGFFIDTGAQGDYSKVEGVEEEEERVVEGEEERVVVGEREVLGAQDEQTERKQRERAARERGLASFLFGKGVQEVKVVGEEEEGVESEEEEESEEEHSDLEESDVDVDSDAEPAEKKSKEDEGDEDEEDGSEDEDAKTVSAQPSLPLDVLGGALGLEGHRRKRKAAWVDREDKDIKVKVRLTEHLSLQTKPVFFFVQCFPPSCPSP